MLIVIVTDSHNHVWLTGHSGNAKIRLMGHLQFSVGTASSLRGGRHVRLRYLHG